MTTRSDPGAGPAVRHRIQHRMIFSVSFAVYVFAGLGHRLRPDFWRRGLRRSIFVEAWEASGTITELAFAG